MNKLDELINHPKAAGKGDILEFGLMWLINQYKDVDFNNRKIDNILKGFNLYLGGKPEVETDVTAIFKYTPPAYLEKFYNWLMNVKNTHANVTVNYQAKHYNKEVARDNVLYDTSQFNTLKNIGNSLQFITLVVSDADYEINFKKRYHIMDVINKDEFSKNYKIINKTGDIKCQYDTVTNLDEITLDDILVHVNNEDKRLLIKSDSIYMGTLYINKKGFKTDFLNVIEPGNYTKKELKASSEEELVRKSIRNMWILLNPSYFTYVASKGINKVGEDILKKVYCTNDSIKKVEHDLKHGAYFKNHDEFKMPKLRRGYLKSFEGNTEGRMEKYKPVNMNDKNYWKIYDKFMNTRKKLVF